MSPLLRCVCACPQPAPSCFRNNADRRWTHALLRAIGPRRLRWFEPASSTSALEIILSFHASCPQASVRDDARKLLHELLETTGLVRGAAGACWLAHTAAESAPSFARVLMNAVRDPWLAIRHSTITTRLKWGRPAALRCCASCLRGTDPVEPQPPAWRAHVARVVLERCRERRVGQQVAQLVARLDGERPAGAWRHRARPRCDHGRGRSSRARWIRLALAAPAGSKAGDRP